MSLMQEALHQNFTDTTAPDTRARPGLHVLGTEASDTDQIPVCKDYTPEYSGTISTFDYEVQLLVNSIGLKVARINNFLDAKANGPQNPLDVKLLLEGVDDVLYDVLQAAGTLYSYQEAADIETEKYNQVQISAPQIRQLESKKQDLFAGNDKSKARRIDVAHDEDKIERDKLLAIEFSYKETKTMAQLYKKNQLAELENFTIVSDHVRSHDTSIIEQRESGILIGRTDAETIHKNARHACDSIILDYLVDDRNTSAAVAAGTVAYNNSFDAQLATMRNSIKSQFEEINVMLQSKHEAISQKTLDNNAALANSINSKINTLQKEIDSNKYDADKLGVFPLSENDLMHVRNKDTMLSIIDPFLTGRSDAQSYLQRFDFKPDPTASLLHVVPEPNPQKTQHSSREETVELRGSAPSSRLESLAKMGMSRRKFFTAVLAVSALIGTGLFINNEKSGDNSSLDSSLAAESAAWGAPESIAMWNADFDRLVADPRAVQPTVIRVGESPTPVDLISKHRKYLQALMIITTAGSPQGKNAPIVTPDNSFNSLMDTLNLDKAAKGREQAYNNILVAARLGNQIVGDALKKNPTMLVGYDNNNGTISKAIAELLIENWNPAVNFKTTKDQNLKDMRDNYMLICQNWGEKGFTAVNQQLASDPLNKALFDAAAKQGKAAGLVT